MESPMKKRRGQENSPISRPRTSTSYKDTVENVAKFLSFSASESSDLNSSSSEPGTSRSGHPTARKALKFRENLEKPKHLANFSDLLEDDEGSHSSFEGINLEDNASDDDDDFNFGDYFKKCRKLQHKGIIWNLCKPLRDDDDNSLYNRIMNDPKSAPDVASWFVRYCSCRSESSSTIILYRFFFDCAGYQEFDVKKYNGNFDAMLATLNSGEYTNTVFKSTRFLLEDSSKIAKVLKNGIYYFLQELVIQAHEKDVIYGNIFEKFTSLLFAMRANKFRPLVYASYLFGMKLLTGICMVKEKVEDMPIEGFKSHVLDKLLNNLYVHFTKGCDIRDKNMAALKIESLKELKQFINIAPAIFIDGYNCLVIIKFLVICDVASVRTESLDLIKKIVQNKNTAENLNPNSIRQLSKFVIGRVCDIKLEVILKAIQVFSIMATRLEIKHLSQECLPKMMEAIYYKDFRIASAAAKCLIDIQKETGENDKMLLHSLCTSAKTLYPNLIPLMVEAFAEHTSIFRNWTLIMEILTMDANFEYFPIELRVVLSKIFLESIHLTMTGKSSKQRAFSKVMLNLDNNTANGIYEHVTKILKIYHKESGEIVGNVLTALSKINPEYIGETSLQEITVCLNYFTKMFDSFTDPLIREPLLSFLLYVNDQLPLNETTENVIEELKNNVTADLHTAFVTKNSSMLEKAALVFSKFDLNPYVEWHKLLTGWNISPDPEFAENILACCHHSLIWKLIKIDTRQSKASLDKDISSISSMTSQFLKVCYEVLRSQETLIRFKGFERICEFSLSFEKHLQQKSKQERTLGNLKLTFNDDLENEILSFLKAAVEPNTEAEAYRFCKYITYIRQLAYAEILPVPFLSNIFIYYDQHYEHYGNLIDLILIKIREVDENWIAMLIVNAISLLHKSVLDKHGAVNWRNPEGKAILRLSKRFLAFKKIMSPSISGKILFFAVNYVSKNHLYDFLIYVTCFSQDTVDRRDIINNIEKKIPQSARKEIGVKYLLEHLQQEETSTSTSLYTKKVEKKAQPKPLNITITKKQSTNPPSRNPSLSSSSCATVEEISLQDKSIENMETSDNSE